MRRFDPIAVLAWTIVLVVCGAVLWLLLEAVRVFTTPGAA